MITYKETNRVREKWGIDVTVQFVNDSDNSIITIIFGFKNEKDIDDNYKSVMARKVAAIEEEATA